MRLIDAPSKIVEGFAVNGSKNVIPLPSQIPVTPGAASFNDGFPPLTMTPVSGGGVPPSGLDMNGILFMLSVIDNWMSAGGGFVFDATFAAAIGGYPKGARVLAADGTGYWLCTTDNNSTNPDTGGAGWVWLEGRKAKASVILNVAAESLPPGWTKLAYDTVEFDSFGLWNAANHRFVAPWAGIYRISGLVFITGAAVGGQSFQVGIYKNGAIAKAGPNFISVNSIDQGYPFDVMMSLAAGDYLEVFFDVSTTAVGAPADGRSNYAQIEYLGT